MTGYCSKSKEEFFKEAIHYGFLIQHVSKKARLRERQTSNILDLVFSKDESDINNIIHFSPLGKSEHHLLQIIEYGPRKIK